MVIYSSKKEYADVAELADAQVSDSCGYCFLVGSSPIVRTNKRAVNLWSPLFYSS